MNLKSRALLESSPSRIIRTLTGNSSEEYYGFITEKLYTGRVYCTFPAFTL